jgi:DNA-binding SARP family transcriptional activator
VCASITTWPIAACTSWSSARRCPWLRTRAITLLSADILPAWWEEWVVEERERYRQRRLHALEHLGARLRNAGRHALALEAGLAAVTAEPLRESAQRLVVSIHLAEGNRGEALAQYDRFARLLRHALGCAPSPQMEALVA